jgi:hypothetical protein
VQRAAHTGSADDPTGTIQPPTTNDRHIQAEHHAQNPMQAPLAAQSKMVQAQEDLIKAVRESVKGVTDGKPHLEFFCDDACILRFLRARGMDPKKASVMLRDTLQWCALCNHADMPSATT